MHAPDVREVLSALTERTGRDQRLLHLEVLPPRNPQYADWPAWTHPDVRSAVESAGVSAPWSHQVEAAELVWTGRHVVMSTGTASGKSLGYLLPALSGIRTARGAQGQRRAATLYVSPTKALAHDQAARVDALRTGVRVATHDGDSTPEEREWTRDHAEYVLTNPDMLHRSLLPGHERWARFFGSLRHVVIDECHHYRGVFGAHVAQIVRRLRRICAHYGADPTFVLASATVAEPEVTARRLTGLPVVAVTADGSPRGQVALGLWEPPLRPGLGEHGAPVRRTAGSEAADLLTDLVVGGVRTLAFVRSRQGAERIARDARSLLAEVDPSLPERVAAYRGGYLPEERRALERALRDGRLLGLAATNALELGIDVAGLDAVLVAGFPGTRAALWQQFGRAGRGQGDALGLLVARDDPLDTYLVHHPEVLFGQPVEAIVFDPDNPYVLEPHLAAAAAEIPLTEEGLEVFGPEARPAVDRLAERGVLRKRARGWFWTDRSRASDLADIRSTGGQTVRLVEASTGRVVGTVDGGSAHSTAHTGAVMLHQGETWTVRELDLDEHVAFAEQHDPGHTTTAREITDIVVLEEREHRWWGPARISTGTVRVTHQVVSYLVKNHAGEVQAEYPLDLPERTLETVATWWTLPDDEVPLSAEVRPGAAHAAEHAAIGLLPLFATCDRWDIGGVSTALHPDTGMLTVFVHDGHPGGAGFAERGYRAAASWWQATLDLLRDCECEEGCPSCVQSPKCGNGNEPLDKHAARLLLERLLAQCPEERAPATTPACVADGVTAG